MKTPKILPWLARRSGLSDHRAEQLWGEALRHATRTTEWVGTPEFWTAAMDKLQELIDAELPGEPTGFHAVRLPTSLASGAPSGATADEEATSNGAFGDMCFQCH